MKKRKQMLPTRDVMLPYRPEAGRLVDMWRPPTEGAGSLNKLSGRMAFANHLMAGLPMTAQTLGIEHVERLAKIWGAVQGIVYNLPEVSCWCVMSQMRGHTDWHVQVGCTTYKQARKIATALGKRAKGLSIEYRDSYKVQMSVCRIPDVMSPTWTTDEYLAFTYS